jgi:hypothetical protein
MVGPEMERLRSYLEVTMACCAALAVVFAVVRGAWARILGRGPVEEMFPPAATWRPGVDAVEPRDASAAVTGTVIGGPLAATVLAYALLVHLLVSTGLAQIDSSGWFVRDAVLTAIAVSLLVLGRRRTATASALVGVGALWFALGVTDMHVFGGFEFRAVPPALDAAFHLSGWWLIVAAAGVSVAQRRAHIVPVGSAA